MRVFLISTILLVSIQLSCQQNKNQFSPKYSVVLPSNKGEEMMAQCSRSTPQNIVSFFEPTDDEILLLKNNFNQILEMKSTQGGFSEYKY